MFLFASLQSVGPDRKKLCHEAKIFTNVLHVSQSKLSLQIVLALCRSDMLAPSVSRPYSLSELISKTICTLRNRVTMQKAKIKPWQENVLLYKISFKTDN